MADDFIPFAPLDPEEETASFVSETSVEDEEDENTDPDALLGLVELADLRVEIDRSTPPARHENLTHHYPFTWQEEVRVLYSGHSVEKTDFLAAATPLSVSSIGMRGIFELMDPNQNDEVIDGAVTFIEGLLTSNPRSFASIVTTFEAYDVRLVKLVCDEERGLASVTGIKVLNLLRGWTSTSSRNLHPCFSSEDVLRDILEYCFDGQAGSILTREETLKVVLDYIQKLLRRHPLEVDGLLGNYLYHFLSKFFEADEDPCIVFREASLFQAPVTDLTSHTSTNRGALACIVGTLLLGHDERYGGKVPAEWVDLLTDNISSDIVWEIYAWISGASPEWFSPLVSNDLVEAAIDLMQAAKGEGRNLDGQPALRGKLRAVVSTFLNISIDSTYRSLLISEKPLRLLIHFWSNPSLKAHIGDIFSNLFKPPDGTIDLLIELGWRRAYASSGILIDILDI